MAYLSSCTNAEDLKEDIESVEQLELLASLPLARPWIVEQILEFSTHPWLLHEMTVHRGYDLIRQHEIPLRPMDFMGDAFWDKQYPESFAHLIHLVPLLAEPSEGTDHSVTAWGVAIELRDAERRRYADLGCYALEVILKECARKGYSLDAPDGFGLTAMDYIDQFGSEHLREAFPSFCGLK